MTKYKKIDVSEQQLEELVRRNADQIEGGLVYVDHQRQAATGRLDVLLVDSGHALVVAELKVVEDDSMLLQGLDYYDYMTRNIESYARLYKEHGIDPTQQVRLLLVAPSFSQTLINRCKWIEVNISLFTYVCISLGNSQEVVPVFSAQAIPSLPETIVVPKLDDHMKYITDHDARNSASVFLDEIQHWDSGRISLDARKNFISMKVDGRVFAYLYPLRKYYVVSTYSTEDNWTDFPVKNGQERASVMSLVKESMDRILRRRELASSQSV